MPIFCILNLYNLYKIFKHSESICLIAHCYQNHLKTSNLEQKVQGWRMLSWGGIFSTLSKPIFWQLLWRTSRRGNSSLVIIDHILYRTIGHHLLVFGLREIFPTFPFLWISSTIDCDESQCSGASMETLIACIISHEASYVWSVVKHCSGSKFSQRKYIMSKILNKLLKSNPDISFTNCGEIISHPFHDWREAFSINRLLIEDIARKWICNLWD